VRVLCDDLTAVKKAQRILAIFGLYQGKAYAAVEPTIDAADREVYAICLGKPLASFTIKQLEAIAGVQVTAE